MKTWFSQLRCELKSILKDLHKLFRGDRSFKSRFMALISHSKFFKAVLKILAKWLCYINYINIMLSTISLIGELVFLKNLKGKNNIILSICCFNTEQMVKENCINSLVKWRQIYKDISLDPASAFQRKLKNDSSCWHVCQSCWKMYFNVQRVLSATWENICFVEQLTNAYDTRKLYVQLKIGKFLYHILYLAIFCFLLIMIERIMEYLRLDGTSGDHLAQPLAQSTVT